MNQYKVTIAMPVYNVAPYVERSLLSALSQSFQNIEFLIIDDKGTDNSMEISESSTIESIKDPVKPEIQP